MKTSGRCTKCQHGQLWRIEKIGVKETGYGTNMPIQAVDRSDETYTTKYDAGHVDAYVCAACGFSELYWSGLKSLKPNPNDGVHLLVTESTPYR